MNHSHSHCQDALRWLKGCGWDLAPLTGQDYPVLRAIAHCWDLWTRGDDAGRRAAVDAAAALLDGCQEVAWPMARELIAHAGDWSHRNEVWPEVVKMFDARVDDASRAERLARCYEGHPRVHP